MTTFMKTISLKFGGISLREEKTGGIYVHTYLWKQAEGKAQLSSFSFRNSSPILVYVRFIVKKRSSTENAEKF